MRTLPSPIRFVALLVSGLGILAGCSSSPQSKVDVTAQIQDLKSGDSDKIQNACVELAKAKKGAAPAVDELIPLLQNANADVRRLVAYALGEIGPAAAKAVPALKGLYDDSDRRVVTQVINSMRQIDPASAPKGNLPNTVTPTPP